MKSLSPAFSRWTARARVAGKAVLPSARTHASESRSPMTRIQAEGSVVMYGRYYGNDRRLYSAVPHGALWSRLVIPFVMGGGAGASGPDEYHQQQNHDHGSHHYPPKSC